MSKTRDGILTHDQEDNKPKHERNRKIAKRLIRGETAAMLGREYGINKARVYQIARKHGYVGR